MNYRKKIFRKEKELLIQEGKKKQPYYSPMAI